MEKTLVEKDLGLPKLFDLRELLDTLELTPLQIEKKTFFSTFYGMTEGQIRYKGRNSSLVKTGRFGENSCLYYLFYKDIKGYYLFLFNDEKECFQACFFCKISN